MQRTCVLLAAAGIACAPLGCQTVSDVFNEPPADPQRSERAEEERQEREREEEAREARRDRMERMEEVREDEAEEARRESREARRDRQRDRREDAREAREERRERQREARRERRGDRSGARDYIAASSCPAAVDGARVSMVDITDGIALDFRAEEPRDVEVVRERARRLANMRREVRSASDVDDPQLEALPPARVEYDIQPEGARIEFKVERDADLRELRTQLRERMDVMRDEGECPRDFMTMRTRSGGRAG